LLTSFSFSFSEGERAVLYLFNKKLFFHIGIYFLFNFGVVVFGCCLLTSFSFSFSEGERVVLYLFTKNLFFHTGIYFFSTRLCCSNTFP